MRLCRASVDLASNIMKIKKKIEASENHIYSEKQFIMLIMHFDILELSV